MKPFLPMLALGAAAALCGCSSLPSPYPNREPLRDEARLFTDFLSARYAENGQDTLVAAARYGAALAQDPDDPLLREAAITAALAAGDPQTALAAARLPPGPGGPLPLAQLTLAAEAIASGRYRAAQRHLEVVGGGPTDRMAALLLSAWSSNGAGDLDAALAKLQEAEMRMRAAGIARLAADQRGLLLVHAGRYEEARQAFTEGEPALVRLSAVDFYRGAALERLGRPEEAREVYANRLNDGYDARVDAALARLDSKGPLKLRLEVGEGAAIGVVTFAAAFAGLQPAELYLPYITIALLASPGSDDLRLLLAEAQRSLGRPEAAERALAEIAATSPYAATAEISRAWLAMDRGAEDSALAAGARAAASGKRFALAAQADLNRQAQRWKEAEALYDQLLEADREDWRIHFLRGAVRERQGRWQEAEQDLQRALALEPEQPEVLNYLGYGWIDRGENLEEGLALLERAVRLSPDAGHIIDSLGWAQYRLGRYDDALNNLERAAELTPTDPAINDHLGDLYWALSRRREARYQWERALSLAEEPSERLKIEQKLADPQAAMPPAQAKPQ